MDLLGSILGNMDTPGTNAALTKERQMAKQQKERMEKIAAAEKKKLAGIRDKLQARIDSFVTNDELTRLKFEPMDHTIRSVLRDIIDIAGLTSFSFGTEDVDRHIIVFKSTNIPNEDELAAMRRGEEYDPEKIKADKERKEKEESLSVKESKMIPNTNYHEKYSHLIGLEAGKSSAQATVMNEKFGFVPSSNKRDQRSIEQTLQDIKDKKKKKLSEDDAKTDHQE